MSDLDREDVLVSAFDSYRAETDPLIRPEGAAAAFSTVRHRRRVRTAGVAACAVLAVLVGGGTYATLAGPPQGDPNPGVTLTTAPQRSAAASPSPRPVSPSPAVTGGDLLGLADAALDLHAFAVFPGECPGGWTKFDDGKAGNRYIDSVVSTDLDDDGTPELVALIFCRPGEIPLGQVVAFRRDDDKFVTIGVVAQIEPHTVGSERTPNAVERIRKITGAGPGQVRVEVGNIEATYSDLSDGPVGIWQWRVFRWNGDGFTQVAGSPAFAFEQSGGWFSVTVDRLAFGPAVGGRRPATLTVTVDVLAELDPGRPLSVLVSLPAASGYKVERNGCADGAQNWVLCRFAELSPGLRTLTFEFDFPADPVEQIMRELRFSHLHLRVGDQEFMRSKLGT
ncbi:hypothetical protein [Catellatospora paridis]|uniref:hypothetical protein n=1 Tax=Catellatospora paridis TaxID=1617086 RepID=UPI0012D43336|nr:hypothetical protein [Catellatospora paridis]